MTYYKFAQQKGTVPLDGRDGVIIAFYSEKRDTFYPGEIRITRLLPLVIGQVDKTGIVYLEGFYE
ncbi:MAG: hypothetical protein MUP98_06410 [Candidatus Aminicenantes bacterium]|nr:hypothetical protein [Candidatus Aminicenantes bacterium]